MTAINAEAFYKANIDQEKEYVRIYAAREVKAGEKISLGIFPGSAHEDGYELSDGNGFLSKADFAEKTVPAETLEPAVPKEDLDAEDLENMKPVKKGDSVVVDFGFLVQTTADYDGFLFKTSSGSNVYMSNFNLTSHFNYAGQKYETQKEFVVSMKDEAPVKGIIIGEETTFAFKGGGYTAPAGSFIYPNPEDEDGYTVDDLKNFPNSKLRLSPGWTARQTELNVADTQHDATVDKQAKLNARAPRPKLV